MDENHYYPFGLKHQKYSPAGSLDLKAQSADIARPGYATSTDFLYRMNGKEWQDELGLNMYDMDMRQYDPAIARWVVLDPVIHHSMSPYNAFDNNPVFWADPSGADSNAMSAFPDRNLETFGTTDTMEIAQMRDGGGGPPTGGDGKKNGDPTEKKDGALATNNQKPLKEKSGSALSKYKTNTKSKSQSQTKSKTQVKLKPSSSNPIKNYIVENKDRIIADAKTLQKTGDAAAVAGLGIAAVGAPIYGVGATPGLTIAAYGGVMSTFGSIVEIGTEWISTSDPSSVETTIENAVGEFFINEAIDFVMPGPTPPIMGRPDVNRVVNEGVKQGSSIVIEKVNH